MKTNTLLIIGAVAVAGFVLWKRSGGMQPIQDKPVTTLSQSQANTIAKEMAALKSKYLRSQSTGGYTKGIVHRWTNKNKEAEYNSLMYQLNKMGYIEQNGKALKAIGVTMQPQFIGWGFSGGAINQSFRNY